MTTYSEILSELRASVTNAKDYIPRLCQAAREEDPTLNEQVIRDRVKTDCIALGLSADYVRDCIPKEFKDKVKAKAGKKGKEKQEEEKKKIELLTDGSQNPAQMKRAEDSPKQPKKDDSETFDSIEKRGDVPKHGVYEEPIDPIFDKPKLDDIADHPLFLRSQALNEELRGQLDNARQAIQQLQEALKAQGMFKTAEVVPSGHSSTLKIPGPMLSKMFQMSRNYLASRDAPRFYLEAICDGDNIVDFREPTR